MSKESDVEIVGHEYDGIKEFDNPLPKWWLATFYITIVFSVVYWIHYEMAGGKGNWAELKEDLAAVESIKASAPTSGDSEEGLQQLLGQAPVLEQGKAVFAAKCAVCHGQELQGLIGPNLVDDYWIHGTGKLMDIAGVVRKGVLDKGMPNWDGQLKDDEIRAVTVFIASNFGKEVPNPKAPQGEKVAR